MMAANSARELTFWSLIFVWASFYGLRQLIFANVVFMQGKWGYSKEQIGMIVSSFSLAYGIGKFLAGNLVDRLNPKLLLLNGLFASGILMLSFPLVPNWIFSVFVAISFGLLGGSGWPGCAKLLILWYKPEEKGLRYSTVSMSGNVAAAIIPVVLSRATQWGYPWWYSFFALGCTSIVTAGVSYKTISLPEKPATEVYSNEKVASKVSYYDILLCNNTLWCLCGFGTLLSITRYTVISWNQLYFTEHAGIPLESAVLAMTWYQVGGVMGCFLCGASTDWFIRKNLYLKNSPRAAGLGVFTLPFAFCFLLYATTIHSGISQTWLFTVQFLIGFFGEGASTPIGLATMETVDKSFSGSAHAFLSLFTQIGNLIAGYPFSLCLTTYGWGPCLRFVSFLPFGALLLVVMSCLFRPPVLKKKWQ